jgi:hypothetical protein
MRTAPMNVLLAASLAASVSAPGLAQEIIKQPGSPGPHDGLPAVTLPGLKYDAPFFPNATYNKDVPTPDSLLGFPVGSRPANHGQIESVIKAIAAKSPRVKLVEYARSHEGRALYYAVISTPERLKDLDALKADYALLADPRKADAAKIDALANKLPALAWMAYVIHGDEMSGSDASLAVLHHLAASEDEEIKKLLEQVVVVIDPLMNPDGRDRWLNGIRQNRTKQPQVDDQALLHDGVWPRGRMNHYLFDLNRDWIFATQPESRGRIAAVRDWNPHYFMESHEMGSQDTFLFMPAREAINPNHAPSTQKWVAVFGREQAAAFDAKGWRYYTGEWNDDWYPGYSSSWAGLRGSVQNLYEQAAINIDAVRRPEGSLEAYREGVHKQLVSSMANLFSLGKNRKAVLTDFVSERRRVLADDSPYAKRAFAILPGGNAGRLKVFLDLLTIQGIEFVKADKAFTASGTDRLGRAVKDRAFPEGTILIPNRQPLARLLAAMLEFDPRMTPDYLTSERRELLRFGRSKIYDITGWSIPMIFDVEAYELSGDLPAAAGAKPLAGPAVPEKAVAQPVIPDSDSPVGYAIDGGDDRSVAAAARLMERGLWLRLSTKPTTLGATTIPRGSVFILKKDNLHTGLEVLKILSEVAKETGTEPVGLKTGWGDGDLPDLGGENFVLLQQPRIAVLGRDPASPYSFGQIWYTLDHVLGVRASYLNFETAAYADLRRYNVLILPEGTGSRLADRLPTLKAWTEAGGTLIALGDAAGALASEKGLGSVRTLDEALTKPEPFIQAVIREYQGLTETVAAPAGYEFSPRTGEAAVEFPWDGSTGEKPSDDEVKRRDEWRQIFMPQGAVLAGRTDDRSWLTSGANDAAGYVPVLFGSGTVLVSPAGQAPVRLGVFSPLPPAPPTPKANEAKPADGKAEGAEGKGDDKKTAKPKPGWSVSPAGHELRLRMSGLLWPEAADRLANSAYLTREQIGAGQVILFASDPNFRAATLGTARLFANAAIYGPGMGTSQPIKP